VEQTRGLDRLDRGSEKLKLANGQRGRIVLGWPQGGLVIAGRSNVIKGSLQKLLTEKISRNLE